MYDDTTSWILETLYKADKPDSETVRIYRTLNRYIHDNRDFYGCIENVTPHIMRFKPLTDLADDCFYSVTFFSNHIKIKNKRHGAPNVKFYENMGKNAFHCTGWTGISERWSFWRNYVNKNIWSGPK